jgi:hypothetical protein
MIVKRKGFVNEEIKKSIKFNFGFSYVTWIVCADGSKRERG